MLARVVQHQPQLNQKGTKVKVEDKTDKLSKSVESYKQLSQLAKHRKNDVAQGILDESTNANTHTLQAAQSHYQFVGSDDAAATDQERRSNQMEFK